VSFRSAVPRCAWLSWAYRPSSVLLASTDAGDNMIRWLTGPLVALGILIGPSLAQGQKCPVNANDASRSIWGSGSIGTGKTVTAMHPCGRQITCRGGSLRGRGARDCRWG
jgi:hypothetical protein